MRAKRSPGSRASELERSEEQKEAPGADRWGEVGWPGEEEKGGRATQGAGPPVDTRSEKGGRGRV